MERDLLKLEILQEEFLRNNKDKIWQVAEILKHWFGYQIAR